MKMEDLLQSQIQESCRLALPEGLRDLMSDISREVLRAQPPDLYNFIVSYLEAMLVARDTLCVACQVCRDVCQCACHPELEEELRNLGLDGDDLETAKNVVMEYFDKDDVKEENLLMKLFNKTDIDPNLLPDIQDAVRIAFQKHLRVHHAKHWMEAENSNKIGKEAANSTLAFYDRVQESKEQSWNASATKLQAAFREQLVPLDGAALKLKGKLAQIESSTVILQPPVMKTKDDPERASTSRPVRNNIVRQSLSSTSLAGSLVNLPKYIPYSVHDMTYVDFEEREMEHKNIDYTLDTNFKDSKKEEGTKRIVFYEQNVLHEIKSFSIEEESVIEENIADDIQSEVTSVDENIIDDKSVEEYIVGEDQSGFDEDIVDEKPFNEDIVQELVSNIDMKNIKPNETSLDESIVEESTSQNKILSDHQEGNIDFESMSFDEQNHLDYMSIDDDYIEEENSDRNISIRVGSRAHIEMLKTLKKKLITLSKTTLTGDEDKEDDTCSLSSD